MLHCFGRKTARTFLMKRGWKIFDEKKGQKIF
jgi:hypothetical protein